MAVADPPGERERMLAARQRVAEREKEGPGPWSLGARQRALRHAEDGWPKLSRDRLRKVLHAADFGWQKDRRGGQTGKGRRQGKRGTVEVTEPDAEAPKEA